MEAGHGSAQKSEGVAPDAELPEKIPFQVGTALSLRSAADPSVKAQTRVVGVIDNIAVLVEDPLFAKDHIEGRVGGDIQCAYLLDGFLFKFKSRFGQYLVHNIICIDYPKHFEAKRLRMHQRIKVDLEAESVIGEEKKLINGDITDISQGGCCLELSGIIPLPMGTPVSLTFVLPNDEQVENLGSTIVNLRHTQGKKTTEIGLSFSGPDAEMVKVRKFCEMCMYFRM